MNKQPGEKEKKEDEEEDGTISYSRRTFDF